jgi:hypothetical protein
VRGVLSSIILSTCSRDRPWEVEVRNYYKTRGSPKKARGRTFVSGTRKYAYTNAHVQRPPQMKKTEERRSPWSGLTMYGVMTAMI